jgi:hypothetical protein
VCIFLRYMRKYFLWMEWVVWGCRPQWRFKKKIIWVCSKQSCSYILTTWPRVDKIARHRAYSPISKPHHTIKYILILKFLFLHLFTKHEIKLNVKFMSLQVKKKSEIRREKNNKFSILNFIHCSYISETHSVM